MVDDQLGGFRRGLSDPVGHQIGNGLVLLVAYSGDNGYREFGNGFSDEVLIEEKKISLGTPAADDDSGIIRLPAPEDGYQRIDELLGIDLALDHGIVRIRPEGITMRVVVQGMFEVLPAGGSLGTDDGDLLNDPVENETLVLRKVHIAGPLDELRIFG